MAEGFGKELLAGRFEVFSAGVEAHGLNPRAVEAMKEIHIDISKQRSKIVDEVPYEEMDLIITLCGHAAETCPAVSGKTKQIHWDLDDPARATGSEEEIRQTFRRVRDEIRNRILGL
jgi:arsenate reductase